MTLALTRPSTRLRSRGLRVVFAGGGTGGHLAPGMALADRVLEASDTGGVLFLSTDRPAERAMLDPGGYPRRVIASDPPGRSVRRLARFAVGQLRAIVETDRVLREFGADVVVGLGGYGSVAGVVAAARRGLPVVLLEQNAVVGRANRLLCPLATEVHCQWPSAWEQIAGRARVRLTGPPLRSSIGTGSSPRARESLGLARRVPTLLVMGGSQGSQAINRAFEEARPELRRSGIRMQVIHITGEMDTHPSKEADEAWSSSSLRLPFLREIDRAYQAADLVVGRAGATSIAEIAAVGVPALLIPYPHATDSHQQVNAECYARRGAAEILPESEMKRGDLARRIIALLGDASRRQAMSHAARRFFPGDGSGRSIRCLEALHGAKRTRDQRHGEGGPN